MKRTPKKISTLFITFVSFLLVVTVGGLFLGRDSLYQWLNQIYQEQLENEENPETEETPDPEDNEDEKTGLPGKTISFMGDSITTYSGWNNNTSYNTTIGSNAVWYTSDRLSSVDYTWWKKTIDTLELELCVNNSWSGSRVTTTRGESPASCMTRATNLHNNNKNIYPDIICVYIGINDYNGGVTLGSFNSVEEIYDSSTNSYIGDLTEFADAYATMVHKIISTYETADVYLCTLVQYKTALSSWNNVIKKIADEFDCNVVDFYEETGITPNNLGIYTIDNLHPSQSGMSKMSECLVASLQKNYE